METLIRFYDFLVILIFLSLLLFFLPSVRPPSTTSTVVPGFSLYRPALADGLMVTPVSAPRAPTNDTFLCEFSASAFSRRPRFASLDLSTALCRLDCYVYCAPDPLHPCTLNSVLGSRWSTGWLVVTWDSSVGIPLIPATPDGST